MKKFALLTLATMALMTTACGSKKDYAGTLGSCNSGSGVCTTWSYTASMKDDPAAEAKAQAKQECGTDTWADTACPTTGSVGTCTVSSAGTSGGETFTMTGTIVFTSPQNTSSAQMACTAGNGTFKAP